MMDLTATTNRAPQAGETVTGIKFQTAPGGKGANQAVQCARLGAQVTMVGCVGDDTFGTCLRETVANAGVDISHVKVDPTECSGVGHILVERTSSGVQNRITICPGANLRLTVDDVRWLETEIGQYDLVMLQFELPMAVNEAVASWASRAAVPVMVNPAPAAPISPELCSCTTYLTPNETEAALLSGVQVRSTEEGIDVTDAAQSLHTLGVKNLIITLGARGAALWEDGAEKLHNIPCIQAPQVADPTAAGDSFVAAFSVGICTGLAFREAAVFASYTAALTVSKAGAIPSLPDLQAVAAFMEERGAEPALREKIKQMQQAQDSGARRYLYVG